MAGDVRSRDIAVTFAMAAKEALGENVVRVMLYGSAARGEDHPGSDLDLVLVVREKDALGPLSSLLGEWIAETGVVIDLLVVTPDEMDAIQARRSAFAHALRDEGEVLA